MKLRGQHGYAMAALLVAMSVAAVLVSALMPTWKTMARREKEAELVFRGEQYVRAIGLFQRRAGPGVLPPNIDVLVSQRYLRKKYKDPVTGQDFDVLSPTTAAGPDVPGGRGVQGGATGRGGVAGGVPGQAAPPGLGAVAGPQGAGGRGGIMGVASRSRETSLRLYNGRNKYNEWQFVYVQQAQAPAAGAPGGRGGPPQPGGVGRGGPGSGFGRPGAPPGQPAPGQRGNAPLAPQPQPLAPRPLR